MMSPREFWDDIRRRYNGKPINDFSRRRLADEIMRYHRQRVSEGAMTLAQAPEMPRGRAALFWDGSLKWSGTIAELNDPWVWEVAASCDELLINGLDHEVIIRTLVGLEDDGGDAA